MVERDGAFLKKLKRIKSYNTTLQGQFKGDFQKHLDTLIESELSIIVKAFESKRKFQPEGIKYIFLFPFTNKPM